MGSLGPAGRGTWRVVGWSAATGLALAGVVVTAAGPWEGGQRAAERRAAADLPHHRQGRGQEGATRAAPRVLTPVGARQAPGGKGASELPLPTAKGMRRALGPLLDSPDLGTRRSLAVVDTTTGELVYGVRAKAPATPASTMKIATAVAALTVLGADHRIPTVVTTGSSATEIVLVGGGDPTLTALSTAGSDRPASLRELAGSTAAALRDRGVRSVRLRYDATAYSGPRHHPIGRGNENIAPVTALMVDEGRVDPRSTRHAPRVADPARDAAEAFADLLREEGVAVRGKPSPGRGAKASDAPLAEVRSQPLGTMVERALTTSDNDIAEALARQTALARNEPASFAGAGRAVTSVLEEAGLDVGGARIRDGSGLDREDQLSAELLADLLALAASPEHPQLRSALTGLPVAGFTGTLEHRYTADRGGDADGADRAAEDTTGPGRSVSGAAGLVRAKTGTLTGVNTLAGTTVDADGRLLAFAFTASGTSDPDRATAALDRLAAALARCGCR